MATRKEVTLCLHVSNIQWLPNVYFPVCFQLPRCTMPQAGFKFMDAYEAEGLLGVCVFLVKVFNF